MPTNNGVSAEIAQSDQRGRQRNMFDNSIWRGSLDLAPRSANISYFNRYYSPSRTSPVIAIAGFQELVDSKKRIRKIRIILIVFSTLIVAGLIAVAVVLLLRSSETVATNTHGIELEDVITGKLSAKKFNGSWVSDKTIIYRDGDLLWEYDVKIKQRSVLVNSDDERITQSFIYEKSPDNKYLLIAHGHIKIFRYSFSAFYDIVNLQTGQIYPVNISNTQVPLILAKWAPVGSSLILNFERNLYYKPSPLEKEIPLTFDGSAFITNGHPDWVYEEEVFNSNIAVWFNPSGTKIAFVQFDDKSTRVIDLPLYGPPGDLNFQYPLHRRISYPKAGSSNPFIKLYQIDLMKAAEGQESKFEILVPGALNTEAHIITAVEWLTDDTILSVWMNRIQNRAYIQVSNDSSRYEILSLQSYTGWVDLFNPPQKNKFGTQVALILPQKQGDAGDFRHLTLLLTKNSANNKPISLTNGRYVVQQIYYWDYESNLIFYSANLPDKTHVLHIFAVKAEPGQKPTCLTCDITVDGLTQTYFTAEFSPSGKFIVITSLGPGIPFVGIYEWNYRNDEIKIKLHVEWENNTDIKQYIANINVPEIEYHNFDIGDGFTAKAVLQLPPGIDKSGSTKYPLLVDVYGGPDSNTVVDKWSLDWGSYLATNRSVIYAKIDGRGSGLQGDKLLHSIYLKLGTYEVFDQINVTKALQNKLPYIDSTRTGIWGWSYGGYVSGMALAIDDKKVFKCATSVAPVTDWAYYDSIYTERYLSLPELNKDGYKKSRLTILASKFKNKKYQLIHGTLDDNVHYQQSMIFAKNLEQYDIFFKQITYPDEDHGLGGVRPHLYHSLDNFFCDCFDIDVKRRK